jgi:hypothetical protein
MAITLHYRREMNFVLTRVFGEIDDSQAKEHVLKLNEVAKNEKALNEIADCRNLKEFDKASVQGIFHAASLEQGQQRAIGGMLVIVVAKDVIFRLARAYAIGAGDVRKKIIVTKSMEEAIEKLDYNDNDKETLRSFIEEA